MYVPHFLRSFILGQTMIITYQTPALCGAMLNAFYVADSFDPMLF